MSITRYQLDLALTTCSPLHSGGAEYNVDRSTLHKKPDAETAEAEPRQTEPRRFARDGANRPVLTGRSVKGALRAAWMEAYGQDPAHGGAEESPLLALWGGEDRAAALTVHSIDLSGAEIVTRMGIAVDRYWGSAGDTALFEHDILPAGETLNLRLSGQVGSVEDDGDPDSFEILLGQLVGLLRAGRVSLGGRQNAGWGRVSLENDPGEEIHVIRDSLGNVAGMLAFLDDAEERNVAIKVEDPPPDHKITVKISWTSPTGILVAEPRDEAERGDRESIPTKPLRQRSKKKQGVDGAGPVVLPGSSVRGALRSRASRIARTVLAADPQTEARIEDWKETAVHQQLDQDPLLVRELFGSTERRGAVRVLETVPEKKDDTREDDAREGDTVLIKRAHNAIDRWTGGVVGGLLFTEEVPMTTWDDLALEIDLRRITRGWRGQEKAAEIDNRRRAALCLLGLVIAELATGTLPLGSRGTRGLGVVEVTKVVVSGDGELIKDPWEISSQRKGAEGGREIALGILERLRELNEAIKQDGGRQWADYLDEEAQQETDGGSKR